MSRSSSHRLDRSDHTPRRSNEGGGDGGGGGCCGGRATNVANSLEAVASPRPSSVWRRSRRKSLDPTETPAGYSYICDAAGDIIENREGNEVLDYMNAITWNVFRQDLMTKWPNVPKDRKNYCIQTLYDTYPQPEGAQVFNKTRMLQRIGKLMSSRRSQARDTYKEGKPQPNWCSKELWQAIKDERDAQPHKFLQQEEAHAS